MSKILSSWLSFLSILFFLSSNIFACSCERPSSPEEALKNWSDAVFTGKIISVNGFDFTFKVEKVWKGFTEKEIVVKDSFVGSSCGSGLKKGKRYVIFASFLRDENNPLLNAQNKPILHIDICSWSARLDNPNTNRKIIKKLGKTRLIE